MQSAEQLKTPSYITKVSTYIGFCTPTYRYYSSTAVLNSLTTVIYRGVSKYEVTVNPRHPTHDTIRSAHTCIVTRIRLEVEEGGICNTRQAAHTSSHFWCWGAAAFLEFLPRLRRHGLPLLLLRRLMLLLLLLRRRRSDRFAFFCRYHSW